MCFSFLWAAFGPPFFAPATPAENKWNFSLTNFCEYGITYDKNGNFLTFRRNHAGHLLDNIAEPVYDGNQLVTIKNNGVASSYAYDVNGNCTTDGLNALKMKYNYLNLTSVAKDMSGNTKAKYTWTADGNKLSVKDGAGTSGFEYVGSLIYTRTGANSVALEGASFNNGRIVTTSTGYESNFFLMDHLGSTRVVVAQTTAGGVFTVKERNDFYPYGMRHSNSLLTASSNRFRFSGKENQTIGDLPFQDFGARFLGSKLPVWNRIDPLAGDYLPVSPYAYCAGNPVRFFDPDGKKIVDAQGRLMYSKGQWTKHASADAKRMGDGLMQTRTGREQFQKLVDNPAPIQLEINTTDAPTKTENGVTMTVNGRAYNFYSRDRETGKATLMSSKIVIFEKNTEKAAEQRGVTPEQSLIATTAHEAEHTSQENVQMASDNTYEGANNDVEKTPTEKANQVVKEYLLQTLVADPNMQLR